MACALVGGMQARGQPLDGIRIVEPLLAQREKLVARFSDVALHSECDAAALAGTDLVVFAVKPQQVKGAASAVAPHLAAEVVVLSIAAGILIIDLARWLGGHRRLVRAMPNTPALIGKGISGIHAAEGVDAAGRGRCAAVLEAAGDVVWVAEESMLDAVTGVSGSGPAYVYLFIEALSDGGVAAGLPREVATKLAAQTVLGGAKMVLETGLHPGPLKDMVTSPGGTTIEGLHELEKGKLRATLISAVRAATEKSRKLGQS